MRTLLAFLPLFAGCAALRAEPPPPPRILAVFAHPDDETVAAPALANAARRGARVRIVYATAGDASAPETDLAPGPAIAARRSEEARCAATALGTMDPVLLDFGDGKLGEITRPAHVGALRDVVVADDVATVRFSTTQGGYPGWYWTVSIAVNPGMQPSVLETELMPAEGALVAPDWVPWADRLEDYLAQQALEGELAGDDGDSDDDDGDSDDDDLDDDSDDLDDDALRAILDGMVARGWHPPRERVRVSKPKLLLTVLRYAI